MEVPHKHAHDEGPKEVLLARFLAMKHKNVMEYCASRRRDQAFPGVWRLSRVAPVAQVAIVHEPESRHGKYPRRDVTQLSPIEDHFV